MRSGWTVADVVASLPRPAVELLPAPAYTGDGDGPRVGLAVEAMKRHTSPEGWELFAGLGHAGYILCGHGLTTEVTPAYRRKDFTHVPTVLEDLRPGTVFMQDKREWLGMTAGGSDQSSRFVGVEALKGRPDVWKGTCLKDAHQRPEFHRESADEIGCHFWAGYYHPDIVCHLAPYVRREHYVRTWHCVDPSMVPAYSPEGRKGALLSGAVSGAYPLRTRLRDDLNLLPYGTTWLPHPGYRSDGCRTPEYLRTLSRYKVSICTASKYGYLLRKVIESVAAGCVVVTDLPEDEIVPWIDDGLVRVHPSWPTRRIGDVIRVACDEYDPERQRHLSSLALMHFDYRVLGMRLATDIETARRTYP